MRITVIGKQHVKGVSKKTNEPYDFIELHYNAPAMSVEGVAAKTARIDGPFYPYDRIDIGGVYVLEFDERGHVVEFYPDPAKAPAKG